MDATTDTNLLGPVRDGDLRAFAELSEHPGHRVLGHCLRRTADHALAEDCLSMVFLEAWRHRRSVRLAGHSLLPWLLAVANNVLRNQRRRCAVPVGTVRSRLSRARERLRQLEAGAAATAGGDHT
jgi:DNA-directed RNA polymerase specialized sigma24 family protein